MKKSILDVIYKQRTHWTCFRYQGSLSQQQEVGKVKRGDVASQNKKGADEKRTVEIEENRGIDWPMHTPSPPCTKAEDERPPSFPTRDLGPKLSEDIVSRNQKELKDLKSKGEQIPDLETIGSAR